MLKRRRYQARGSGYFFTRAGIKVCQGRLMKFEFERSVAIHKQSFLGGLYYTVWLKNAIWGIDRVGQEIGEKIFIDRNDENRRFCYLLYFEGGCCKAPLYGDLPKGLDLPWSVKFFEETSLVIKPDFGSDQEIDVGEKAC